MTPVYFHGLPGGAGELALVPGVQIYCPQRPASGDFAALADQIAQATKGAELHLIGFSAGAQAALRVAALQATAELNIGRIDLIAPAAPLELGDFLPDMAGRTVFRAARWPMVLAALTAAQAAALRFAPGAFLAALFASAPVADQQMLAEPGVRSLLLRVYRDCLYSPQAYRAEVCAYVQPWAHFLAHVTAPVTLWQGDADTWAPPAMAEALTAALPRAELVELIGMGHYSALREALPRILAVDAVADA
ncbi:MAG: alpha/beta hydrolase [Paracoccaceae bacterium]